MAQQSLPVIIGLLLVLLVVLISVVGWRWNQLEVARSSRGRRMVKRMRTRSGRRRLHQRAL